jgi:hypothetical protein
LKIPSRFKNDQTPTAMNNYKFERAARSNRQKALIFTMMFHVFLIGAIAYSGEIDWKDYVPESVKERLGMIKDEPQTEHAVVEKPVP